MFQKKLFLNVLVVISVVLSLSAVTVFAAIGDGAKPISVNSEVVDKLASKNAENNYMVELTKPGKVNITFKHENVEKSIAFWEVDMFDSDKNSVMNNFKSNGDEKSVESTVLYLDKGTYYIRVKKPEYITNSSDANYNLTVNYTENVGQYEIEKNETKESSTLISEVNKPITGNLRTNSDIDFYKYTITNPGKVNIGFEHENVEKSHTLWEIDMFDSEQNKVIDVYGSKGDEQKGQSKVAYLDKGTYFIRVKKPDGVSISSSADYNLSVKYTENFGEYEIEKNDTKEKATSIGEMNKPITGNIRTIEGVDYYKFGMVNSGKVYLSFDHINTERTVKTWDITVFDINNKAIIEMNSKGTDLALKSKEINLAKGTYYVRVKASLSNVGYSDCDYKLAINGKGTLEKIKVIKVVLNGKQIQFDQPPVIENGRTLVPLRAIFEAMNATVSWDSATSTVTSVKLETTIVLKIGDKFMSKNGTKVTLDVPGKIIKGRTLVPARAVAESFGAEVEWNAQSSTVTITQNN